jgi:predicted GNAT family acetyltransferase
MSHVLDRPVWNALTTAHAGLAQGDARARRYPPSIVPFAAAADASPESLAALAALPGPGEAMAIVEAIRHDVPPGLDTVLRDDIVQMVARQPYARISDERIAPLTTPDAAEMLALATLTKPGPFTLEAQALGTFWGIRIDGRLAAMAGQRFRVPGFGELSGLCTHPDFQGRGLGRLLFNFVAGEISARGETAFLHAFAANTHATSLYERLGFTLRSPMHLLVVKRPG